ncbi:hypothetical protein FBUS_03847 [Fasciolopsis buskii]|uniref:Uncharacterized protein n=1 Tax=Fasciolopsis buskii TaxID=27845 RepID=A0A8E0RRP3_9TREM|nr:hypothetical protein FBUS_03847 [Fasciolopsis buski]
MTVDIFSLNGQISVTGSCELVVAPDVCTFEVTIYATKQTATASEQSVKRRSDYARQEIKNILSRNTVVNECFDSKASEDGYSATWKFIILREDVTRMKKLVAHLRTKLGSSVAFGSYEFFISSEKLSKVRRIAIQQAVSDAKTKAETIASAFGQSIRGLVSVVETETSVQPLNIRVSTKAQSQLASNADGKNVEFWSAVHRAAQKCIRVKLDAICALGDCVR